MPATIRQGDSGADVKTWQDALTAAGYGVTDPPGTFGASTDAQTRAWQTAHGLYVDGVVGNQSWTAMTGGNAGGGYQDVGAVATDIAAVPGLAEHTDNAFRYALAKMAARLATNPDYIVAAMAVETGKTFSATAENPLSHAIGLIQFMPTSGGSASKLTGLSSGTGAGSGFEFLRSLTPIEQLEYVEKYFKPFTGKMNNPSDAYLAVFFPSAMGKPPDHVIAEEGTKVYEQNKGFDKTKKGYITAGDVGSAAQYMLNQAAKVPRIPIVPESAPGGDPFTPGESWGVPDQLAIVPTIGIVGLLAGAAYFIWRAVTGR